RKMMLLLLTCVAKSGCVMVQPAALVAGLSAFAGSLRPLMTKRSCTPPSGLPSAFFTNRASRTGPVAVMNDGTVFFAPLRVAAAICGLVAGEVPPVAGNAWH